MTNSSQKFFEKILGSRVYLKRLEIADISEKYVSWLNNPDINQYLECRHVFHTQLSVEQYVSSLLSSDSNEILFGIFLNENDHHIGNIKIGPICLINKHADVGILIGEQSLQSRGYGTEAIQLITDFAVNELHLTSLRAGCYKKNIASFKAFLKAGWIKAGELKDYWIDSNGVLDDEVLLSFTPDPKIELISTGGVTLIGGGNLLIESARFLAENNIPMLCIFAPRHVNDEILQVLKDLSVTIAIVENINLDNQIISKIADYNRLCLCFGPAWIFSKKILDLFQGRIFNFNGIPLPHYLGGAHYTWQILNQSQLAGAYIQQITEKIDRGPIASGLQFTIKGEQLLPLDYEKQYLEKCKPFICHFWEQVLFAKYLQLNNQPIDWNDSMYFPRLNTNKNAWIDWSWTAEHISRFCNSFDDPYPGARTYIDEQVIILKNVSYREDLSLHPYTAGLIVRKFGESELVIACLHGYLISKEFACKKPELIRPGKRLLTPAHDLMLSRQTISYDSCGLLD